MSSAKKFIRELYNKVRLSLLIGRATRLREKLENTEVIILDLIKKQTPKCKKNKTRRVNNSSPISMSDFVWKQQHQCGKC
jgi:phage gp16-like protein